MTHVAAQARVPKKGLLIFLVGGAVLLLLGALTVVLGLVRESRTVQIVSVVDGNRVVVNADGQQKTVAMAGVRSAIRNPDGVSVGPEFCMGEQAYTWLRDRLPQGSTVTMETSSDGAPDGQEWALFRLGGEDVNALMAEEGMAAPTGLGVDGKARQEIADGNAQARGSNVGLYSQEEKCSLNYQLYEATYALDQVSPDAAPAVAALDAKFAEYATALDQVRRVQQEIEGLDASKGTFEDVAYAPAKDELLAEADQRVQEGMDVLREINAKRNAVVTGGSAG